MQGGCVMSWLFGSCFLEGVRCFKEKNSQGQFHWQYWEILVETGAFLLMFTLHLDELQLEIKI
jgi:hypothetical protein